ncbi:unnamed protein product [Rhodiola kirilowii]
MNEEIQSMHDNQSWKLVPKPDNVKAIDCKCIFRIKEGNDSGEPPRFKARLVSKGFSQREGIDFNDIFAPVVKYKTMSILLAMTAVFNWKLEKMDVKTAFLHRDLDERLYMKQPIGFIDKQKPEHVCFLNKSIYGLKQSPRQWNRKSDSCMLSLGFIKSLYDSCLYLKDVKSATLLYVVLYVDDLLLICPSLPVIMQLKDNLKKFFDMKDLGKAQKILGVKIIRDRKNKQILLSQVDYIDKVLTKFSMKDSNPIVVPLGEPLDISKHDCPKTDQERQKMDKIPYDVAVGSIMYAMLCTSDARRLTHQT